jgi:hypothetical protein
VLAANTRELPRTGRTEARATRLWACTRARLARRLLDTMRGAQRLDSGAAARTRHESAVGAGGVLVMPETRGQRQRSGGDVPGAAVASA